MKIALIIDAQNGFIEGGNLAVDGGKKAMDGCANYIAEHRDEYVAIAATADWHPYTHCSFKHMGGMWNMHCLQFSVDAAIYQPILDAVNVSGLPFHVYTKGTDEDREEYSVFKNAKSCAELVNFVEKNNIDEIDVFGIAYDYCVFDTVKDGLRMLPNVKFKVFSEFTARIGGGKEFTDFINSTERVTLI